ncbi:4Fe-4S binding protein [Clostridium sp.]|jgi:polyferredoxin|uniref:4Fe-4S binding protein n=1 Tax=Clostridium sp. TaxID=1506 RepID=UPI00258BEC63|nr:4Fe-4S binding protein [Clostridium sp.]MDF2505005.1 polyferredoxin [Clostridium sp.]
MIKIKNSNAFLIKRAVWYLFGIILFYAPFALYEKVLSRVINNKSSLDVHSSCLRIPLLYLFTGKGIEFISVTFISLVLFFTLTFFFGAFYCGRLCAAGAFPEYLSRLVPEKLKINWYKITNPIPIRYGFLAGYLLTPFLAGSIACAFCNLSFLQRLINGGFWGNVGFLGSTTIITGFLWLFVFGVFTKGGRGYCNFMCPVGAIQGLVQSISSRFGFTFKLRFSKEKCVSCSTCVKTCPMGSLQKKDGKISYQILNCITCRQCEATCPKKAISYGLGKSGWEKTSIDKQQVSIPVREV